MLQRSVERRAVIIKNTAYLRGKFPTLNVLSLCLILCRRASSSSLLSPCLSPSSFSFFLTFRFAARHLLLITPNLHPGKRWELRYSHSEREDDVNDLFISKSKKEKKKRREWKEGRWEGGIFIGSRRLAGSEAGLLFPTPPPGTWCASPPN